MYRFEDFKARRMIIQILLNISYKIGHDICCLKSTAELILFSKELGAKPNKTVTCLKWDLAVSVKSVLGKYKPQRDQHNLFVRSELIWLGNKEQTKKKSFLLMCYFEDSWETVLPLNINGIVSTNFSMKHCSAIDLLTNLIPVREEQSKCSFG